MSNKNYYGIRKGREIGVFYEWKEVERLTRGYSGAEFKKFKTKDQAKQYVEENNVVSDNKNVNTNDLDLDTEQINTEIDKKIIELDHETAMAFVDGSHNLDVDGKEKYGFGAIIFTANNKKNILYKAYVHKKYMESRNVAGEIEGVKQVILWALDNNLKKIIIYYDYEGIEKWAKEEWKANKPISKDYLKFFKEKSKFIDIEFVHTKAHMGIKYNEEADSLAKQSLESKNYKTYRDGSIYFYSNSEKDWYLMIEELNKENCKNKITIEKNEIKRYHNKLILECNNESITINCYNGNNSYLQGKRGDLYEKVVYKAIEHLPDEEVVIDTLKAYHTINIPREQLVIKFNEKVPNFPKDYRDQKHYNNLLTAIFNTMAESNMPDFTCLLHPIFRSTEYYLHRILGDKLGNKTVDKRGRNKFSYFNKDNKTGEYIYNKDTSKLENKQVDLLNKFYNYYNQKRNPYIHWCESSLDTNVVEDFNVAVEIIDDGLKLINKYYLIF